MKKVFTTKQVANLLNIDKSTLLRWIRQGKIEDVQQRDGRNWRVWFQEDIDRVRRYYSKIHQLTLNFNQEENKNEPNSSQAVSE